MGLFSSFKKSTGPYKEESTNLIYELLFCDNIELFKNTKESKEKYPWDILLSKTPEISDLKSIADNEQLESRVRILAFNMLRDSGLKIEKKELLAVIVELGTENGLDILASFGNGTVRYINFTGKMIIWETPDEISNTLTKQLFDNSINVVNKIGPWKEARRANPSKGIVRISFLVSDGLYFGEGSGNILFNDALIGPALISATKLMKYLMEKSKSAVVN
jgi:hypothetical protein